MTFDAGRIRHDASLMHYSRMSNGVAAPSNWKLSATGDTGVIWTPESAGSVSYGSNSNDVSTSSAPGASSLVARTDHTHRGVRTVSVASNTLVGDLTLLGEGSVGLTVAGQTIKVNVAPVTAGGGSVSYGSNSNQVSYANAPGASTLVSRADHVHLGVTSVSHASNTFSGPVILTTEGNLGITVPTPGTFAFKALTGAASSGGGGGGGTGYPQPGYIQSKQSAINGTTSLALDSTPIAGNTIILAINRLGTSTTTSVSSTNTTWTMAAQYVVSGSCLELWVGVCAASPGGTITYTAGTSGYVCVRALEVHGITVTPTIGVTSTVTANGATLTGITPGHYVIGTTTHVDTGQSSTSFPSPIMGTPGVGIGSPLLTAVIVPVWIAYCFGTVMVATGTGGTATLLAEIS